MTPTKQDKELREKIAELMFLKLGIDMGRTDTQYPLLPTGDRDEFLEDVTALFASHLQAYTEEIRKKSPTHAADWVSIFPDADERRRQKWFRIGYNQAVSEQRQALNNIATKWGVK